MHDNCSCSGKGRGSLQSIQVSYGIRLGSVGGKGETLCLLALPSHPPPPPPEIRAKSQESERLVCLCFLGFCRFFVFVCDSLWDSGALLLAVIRFSNIRRSLACAHHGVPRRAKISKMCGSLACARHGVPHRAKIDNKSMYPDKAGNPCKESGVRTFSLFVFSWLLQVFLFLFVILFVCASLGILEH